MADFQAAAELSVTLAPGEAQAVRDELESELADVAVGGGGAAGALGGGAGGSALTDGGLDTVAGQLADQTDLLEDILDELETGGVGGGGGGGGFLSGLAPLSFLAGAGSGVAGGAASGAAGLLSRLMKSGTLRAIATGGASITGGVAAPVLTPGAVKGSVNFVEQFTGGDPKGPDAAEAPGAQGGRAPLSPFNFVDAASTFFGRPDAPTNSELPGNITRQTIRQNRRQGNTPFTSASGDTSTRPNRAKQNKQAGRGPTTINVDVTVEQAKRQLEQAMEQAKREAVREVERKVSQSGAVITR